VEKGWAKGFASGLFSIWGIPEIKGERGLEFLQSKISGCLNKFQEDISRAFQI